MTPEAYRALRKAIGTQAEVAEALKVGRDTIVKREGGKRPIDTEATYAMRWLTVANQEGKSKL